MALELILRRIIKVGISIGCDLTDRVGRMISRRTTAPSYGVVLYYHAVPQTQRHHFGRQMERLRRWAQPWALEAPPPRAPRWVGISFEGRLRVGMGERCPRAAAARHSIYRVCAHRKSGAAAGLGSLPATPLLAGEGHGAGANS